MNRIKDQCINILTLFCALFYSFSSLAAEGNNYPQFLGINLDEKFWVLMAFILFIILVAKKATKAANTALDNRSNTIKEKIDNSESALVDAKKLLKASQEALANHKATTEKLILNQKKLALKNAILYLENINNEIERKNVSAEREIQYMHTEAANNVKNKITTITLRSVKYIVAKELNNDKSNKIFDNFIKNIPSALSSSK
jgi:F0F1-type ATP synthase membrane subunit b/b'